MNEEHPTRSEQPEMRERPTKKERRSKSPFSKLFKGEKDKNALQDDKHHSTPQFTIEEPQQEPEDGLFISFFYNGSKIFFNM